MSGKQLQNNDEDFRDIEYLYLRESGIAIAVEVVGSTAIMATAFVNYDDGDIFDKKKVRDVILDGRLAKFKRLGKHKMCVSATTNGSAKDITEYMSNHFRPNGSETMDPFIVKYTHTDGSEIEIGRLPRTQMKSHPDATSCFDVLENVFHLAAREVGAHDINAC